MEKDQGLEKKWVKSLFPNLVFLFIVSLGRGEIKGEATASLPNVPGIGNHHLLSTHSLDACSEDSAQVVWIVLKCVDFANPRIEAALPMSIG